MSRPVGLTTHIKSVYIWTTCEPELYSVGCLLTNELLDIFEGIDALRATTDNFVGMRSLNLTYCCKNPTKPINIEIASQTFHLTKGKNQNFNPNSPLFLYKMFFFSRRVNKNDSFGSHECQSKTEDRPLTMTFK